MESELLEMATYASDHGYNFESLSFASLKQYFFHDEELKNSLLLWLLSNTGCLNDASSVIDPVATLEECGATKQFNPAKLLKESPQNKKDEEIYVKFWRTLFATIRSSTVTPKSMAESAYIHLTARNQNRNIGAISLIPSDIAQEIERRKCYSKQKATRSLELALEKERPSPVQRSNEEDLPSFLDLQSNLVAIASELDNSGLERLEDAEKIEFSGVIPLISQLHQGVQSAKDVVSHLAILNQEAL